jgi:hypothetical protein
LPFWCEILAKNFVAEMTDAPIKVAVVMFLLLDDLPVHFAAMAIRLAIMGITKNHLAAWNNQSRCAQDPGSGATKT